MLDDLESLKKYAKEHSAFEIENNRYGEGYINLSVTQNGRQWTTISFVDGEEATKVAKALLAFVRANKASSGRRGTLPQPTPDNQTTIERQQEVNSRRR